MKVEVILVLGILLAIVLLEMIFTNFFKKKGQIRDDGIVETFSTLGLLLLTQPLILASAYALMLMLFPDLKNALSGVHFLFGFLLFIIFDDMTQYWWHRACHTVPWLYKLHRPHHNAAYMSIRLVYRNNSFYYLLMPSIWLSGVLIYLGLAYVYAVFLVLKLTIIYGAHTDLRWDKPLYKIKAMQPVMWLLERTISTPATHWAHHGKYKADGITNYKGNYGNMLFLWDIIFGTAKITRQYPEEYGVEELPETNLGEQLLWPIFRAKS